MSDTVSGPGPPAPYLADYEALRHGAGAVRSERQVIEVTGPDAADYLQGQLSQDVATLAPGAVAASLLLGPDGKLQTRLRVSRRGPEAFVCDLEATAGEAALARLERFKLRVRAELHLRNLAMVAVRGPLAPPPPVAGDDDAVVVAPVRWGSVAGWDLVAEAPEPPAGVRVCDWTALEALRIESGVPAVGSELTEGLIPAETGITDETVSFTKGCYVGQELVARIDSRGGNTPRRLRGLVLAGAAVPQAGAALTTPDGAAVGRITSAAFSPLLGAAVALAYVHRRIEPPATVQVAGGGEAEVRTLPLVP